LSGAPSPRLNLAVRRGTSDTVFSYATRHGLLLTEPVAAGTVVSPTTQICVQSTPLQLETETVLEFKRDQDCCTSYFFTTDGVTPAGSRKIKVKPYIGGEIPCRLVADIAPVDLTGRIYQAQVKKKASDPVPYITLNCTTEPLAGLVKISCTTTETEDYNAKFTDLPSTLEELQVANVINPDTGKLLYPQYKAIIEAAWFWDVRYTLGTRIVPEYVGLFWLQAEATGP
jgi:hypothetical protein